MSKRKSGEGKVLSFPQMSQQRHDDSSSAEETLSSSRNTIYTEHEDDDSDSMSSSSSDCETSDNEQKIYFDEKEVFQRVQQLKNKGLWSEDRMWKCAEQPRKKTAWDYMLKEMVKTKELFEIRRNQKEFAVKKLWEEIQIRARHQSNKHQLMKLKKVMEVPKRISEMITEFWKVRYEKTQVIEKSALLLSLTETSQTGNIKDETEAVDLPGNCLPGMVENENYDSDSDSQESCGSDGSESSSEESGSTSSDETSTESDRESDSSPESSEREPENDDIVGRGLLQLIESCSPSVLMSDDETLSSSAIAAESLKPYFALSTSAMRTEVSSLFLGFLRQYQQNGVDWLVNLYTRNYNGILADGEGLGKTIQTIAFIAHLAEYKENWGPHLIVVPTNSVGSWELEFMKWCPSLKLQIYVSSEKQRKIKEKEWSKQNSFNVCITSYKIVLEDSESFRGIPWSYLILDEADRIQNFRSERWKHLLNFQSKRRLLLFRTPLRKNVMELWSLIRFLFSSLFEKRNYEALEDLYSEEVYDVTEGHPSYNPVIVECLLKVLDPVFLRRLRSDVETELPQIQEHLILCPLFERQRYMYEKWMEDARTKESIQKGNLLEVMKALMSLRKISNHANYYESPPPKSPFVDSGIFYTAPLLVWNLLDTNGCILPSLSMFSTTEADYKVSNERNTFGRNIGDNTKRNENGISGKGTRLSIVEQISVLNDKIRKCYPMERPKPKTDPPPLPVPKQPIQFFFIDANPMGYGVERKNGKSLTPLKEHININRDTKMPVATAQLNNFHAPNRGDMANVFPSESQFVKPELENPKSQLVIEERRFQNGQYLPLKKAPKETIVGYGVGTLKICDVFKDFPSMRYFGRKRRRLGVQPLYELEDLNFDRHGYFPLGYAEAQLAMHLKVCPADSFNKNHPHILGRMTDCLLNLTWTLEEQLKIFFYMIQELLIYVPVASVKKGYLNFLRPESTRYFQQVQMGLTLEKELREPAQILYPIFSKMAISCPDPIKLPFDCGKLNVLKRLLRILQAEGHRVVIFTQMDEMLTILENFVNWLNLSYIRLDTVAKIEERQRKMEYFNFYPKIFCFLMSTRTGRAGGNITGADTVIFYDSDCHPTMDAEADARCLLMGLMKDKVDVYRLVSEHTIERTVSQKFNKNCLPEQLVIDDDLANVSFKRESIRDLFNVNLLGSDCSSPSSSRANSNCAEAKGENCGTIDDKEKLCLFERALNEVEDETDLKAAFIVLNEEDTLRKEFDENVPIENLDDIEDAGAVVIRKTEMDNKNISANMTPLEDYALRVVIESGQDRLISEKTVKEYRKRKWELRCAEKESQDYEFKCKVRKLVQDCENSKPLFSKSAIEKPISVTPLPGKDMYEDPCLGYLYNTEIAPKSESLINPLPTPTCYHLLLNREILTAMDNDATDSPSSNGMQFSLPSTPTRCEQQKNPVMKKAGEIEFQNTLSSILKHYQQIEGEKKEFVVSVLPKAKPLRAVSFRSPNCLTIGVKDPGRWKYGKPGRDIFGSCSCVRCLTE